MSYSSSCLVCPEEALSTPLLLSGSEGWVIRRDAFSPAFNTSQMLVRTQLLQVPQFPWHTRLVCGLSLPFPWLHISELKSAQQLLKLGTAFSFHSVLHIIHTKAWGDRVRMRRDIARWFFFFHCSACSHSVLPLYWLCTDTLKSFFSQKLEMFSLVVCLSLLNLNHFIHHLPKQEIKPKISLSSSDVVYFLLPTLAHWDYFRTRQAHL